MADNLARTNKAAETNGLYISFDGVEEDLDTQPRMGTEILGHRSKTLTQKGRTKLARICCSCNSHREKALSKVRC